MAVRLHVLDRHNFEISTKGPIQIYAGGWAAVGLDDRLEKRHVPSLFVLLFPSWGASAWLRAQAFFSY